MRERNSNKNSRTRLPTRRGSQRLRQPVESESKGLLGKLIRSFLLLILCFAFFFLGWHSRNLLEPTVISDACPVQEKVEPPECVQQAQQPTQRIFDQPVTAEGVVEFTFYAQDGDGANVRKWITRVPVPNPEFATPQTKQITQETKNDLQKQDAEKSSRKQASNTKQKTDNQQAAKPTSVNKPKAKETTSAPKPQKSLEQIIAKSQSKAKGQYTVQVSAHKDRSQAEKQITKLEQRGIDGRIERADIEGKGTWYRVRAGANLTQKDAQALADKIRSDLKIKTTIIKQ